ncbi:peptidoglycan DD-metalloendopeptidase family protein [Nocardioides panaciterrulae]|uniref:Murein DD-endopeptidase MepM/ murein hydrolase activator NlpD n=1 Tax=Nocardioides panaciterrulae TaxID=661492 RepID=A0A7Y9JBE2_9ACTN|nr:peptidoglycan DD-metalloendopeptidase family protein [Nocardioides panaciterrulae]NYD42880.1 murein DD-endopeptidase MepM/ murein hydrolase activator NlpD [Nocardioides panaciterrulae]
MNRRTHPSPVSHRWRVRAALAALSLATVGATALPSPALAGTGGSTLTSLASTSTKAATTQQKVADAYAAYVQSRQQVEALSAHTQRLNANAKAAAAIADRLRATVADDHGGIIQSLGDWLSPGQSDLDKAAEAADNAEVARTLADAAQAALNAAIDRTEQDRLTWEQAQQHQDRLEATWSAKRVVADAIDHAQFQAAYDATGHQDHRNRAALRAWTHYLHSLGAAAVVPPAAKQLEDPHHLDKPLEPLRNTSYRAVPGVAQARLRDGRAVTVLPRETVRAVSEAFHRLGLSTVPDGIDATTYACGGLLANAWGSSATLPADATGQWQDLHAVPRSTVQPGDVVVLGGQHDGLAQTAVYVGAQRIIVADPATGVAGVQPLPAHFLGVRRATLASPTDNPQPPSGGVCGPATPIPVVDGSGPLSLPMAAGSYRISAGFGDGGGLWSSGAHTGQDFAAPIGTPVAAAGPGTVTVEHPSWAGNLVRIDHGGGVETLYAHLSRVDVTTGQTIEAGDPVGLVGDLGNTTGPHLHFEVRLDGIPVDPTQVVDVPEVPRPTYTNGELPADALCAATPGGVQQLRCDAAVAFRLMGAQFEADNGAPLCITDSYRSRAGQERVHVLKPNLTATPGTSVHGWGLAVDLCGGIESFDTAEHAWMMTHGPAYGWRHPSWAEPGGSRPEPWHFEYEG